MLALHQGVRAGLWMGRLEAVGVWAEFRLFLLVEEHKKPRWCQVVHGLWAAVVVVQGTDKGGAVVGVVDDGFMEGIGRVRSDGRECVVLYKRSGEDKLRAGMGGWASGGGQHSRCMRRCVGVKGKQMGF